MVKKRGFFGENYLACWKFLSECRWHVVFAVGVFALMFLVGFVFPIFFREEIFKFITEIIGLVEGKSLFGLVVFIFWNNLRASFLAIVFGIGIGIFPLIIAVVNGYLIGFVSRDVVGREGFFILWQLLPHGIFELPAVIFSIGIGMKIGFDLFRGDVKKKLVYNFREGLRFFVFVIFPLLLVAGIIEGLLIFLF